jgi:hypothetical protein
VSGLQIDNFANEWGEMLGGATGVIASRVTESGAWKPPVRVATTAAQTLATDFVAGDTIDGIALADGDRVLVKDQADASENGIWIVAEIGAPDRAVDFDESAEILGAIVAVLEGTVNTRKIYQNTNTTEIVVDTDDITFIALTAGAALTVEETDASPSVPDVATIQVPAGGLTDNGGGDVTLEYAQRVGGGRHKRLALGNLGASHTFDAATANYFTGTLDDETAIDFSGWTAGSYCEIGIRFTQDGTGHTPDFSGAGVTWVGDTEPTWPTDPGVSFETVFWSEDGGATIVGGMLGSGGSALTVSDEGTPLATAADTLDFVGAGVTASGTGATKTITIPGAVVTAADLVALGVVGPLLISDDHSTPIVFADLLLTEDGDDFLYADLG